MSVQLVTANISFGDVAVSRPSVQRLIFAARHNYFPEKTRSYTSLQSLAEDGISTDSNVYRAAQGFFRQRPTLKEFIVGRFEVDSIITPDAVAENEVYSFTINAKDAPAEVTISYSANALDTEEDVVDGFIAAITGETEIAAKVTASKTGTGANAQLVLSHAVAGDWFTVKNLTKVSESFPATPDGTAAQEVASIAEENDNWYVFTSDVKDSAFVTSLAADLSARFAFYAVSLDEADAYTATPATGTFKTLITDSAYLNVYPIYHHEATTTFPEVAELAEAMVQIDQGITLANRIVIGVSESKTQSGTNLTDTQTANLIANGINFFAKTKITGSAAAQSLNQAIVTGRKGGGLVASGEFAFNVIGKDVMTIELEAALSDLLLSQKTGRLAWDDVSLNKVYSSIAKVLKKFSDENGWNLIYGKTDANNAYNITLPALKDITAAQRQSGVLENTSFVAYLKDTIHLIDIAGNLSRPQ